MIEVECGFCGNPIEMYQSQFERVEETYCDEECQKKGMSERFSGSLNKGRTLSEEHKQKLSEAHKGKTIPEEVRQKMSESTSGENAPWYGGLPEETKEKISETLKGRDVHDEQSKKKLSERMSGENNPMYGRSPNWSCVYVEETDREVRSSWEAEIDRLLHDADVEYSYEPDSFKVWDGRSYIPDFIVDGSVAIEVKGYCRDECVRKAERFVENYDYEFVVIGTDLGVGSHFDYEDRRTAVNQVVS